MTKEAILESIRRGLKRTKLPLDQQAMLAGRTAAHPRHIVPARGQLDQAGRVALFTEYVQREFGTVDHLASLNDIPEAVSRYLALQNLPPALVVSPHPALERLPFGTKPMLDIRFGVSGPTDAVSLQHAFAGIAETGTLMLPSGPTRPTSNNLLPDNALVVLMANQIMASYEDAFDWLRETGGMPRNVMLVTGPSRSADIEQTLELGAHGPRRLHIMIVDGAA
jgi:L-lactate dehydrogenase complex protein LldG